jgi:Phage capsid family
MATQINAVSSTLLPPTITAPIFAKATEASAVQSLARRVPLSVLANTAIPVSLDVPTADWVAEGGVKPAAQVGIGVKQMVGKKVALLLPVSEEVANTNPAGLYELLQQDAPTAIARAFDYAVINGKSLRSGGAGPFPEYLAQATSTVALGTTANSSGGLYVDIVNGAGKVVDKNYDFTGLAADPRLKVDAQLQVDAQGRPLYVDSENSAGAAPGMIAGYSTFFNRGVSGRYWRAGDKTQTVTINGTPTGGTFLLMSGGNSTSQAYNATGATLQTAVRAWGGIYAGVTVTGSAGGPYTVTFPDVATNVTAPAAPFSVDQTQLTGGTAATSNATIAATGAGGVDTNLRAVGGDWSQAAYGVGMDISVRISKEASYYDGSTWHSAFQENLVLLLVEAYYGFVMGSKDAFVTYTKGTAAF